MINKLKEQRGAALIFVLVALLALAGVVFSNAEYTWKEARDVRALAGEYQADLMAESGLELVKKMIALDADAKSDTPAELWTMSLTEQELTITITPCNAKLDLNGISDARVLSAVTKLLEDKGLKSDTAMVMADFVDKDNKERVSGSERRMYDETWPKYTPKNEPLETMEEISLAAGWEKIDPQWIEEHFTVWTKDTNKINLNFISKELFMAFLPELAFAWEEINTKRNSGGFKNVSELRRVVPVLAVDDKLYTGIIRYVTVKSEYLQAVIEVKTPFVYEKRRYILQNESAKKLKVLRGDVLQVESRLAE